MRERSVVARLRMGMASLFAAPTRYSAFAPEAFTTRAHFACSERR